MTIFLFDKYLNHHRHHHFVIIFSFVFFAIGLESQVLGLGLDT